MCVRREVLPAHKLQKASTMFGIGFSPKPCWLALQSMLWLQAVAVMTPGSQSKPEAQMQLLAHSFWTLCVAVFVGGSGPVPLLHITVALS